MKVLSLLLFITIYFSSIAQNNQVGIFDNYADIGKPKNAGSSRYDEATQTYYMRGSGSNRDEII